MILRIIIAIYAIPILLVFGTVHESKGQLEQVDQASYYLRQGKWLSKLLKDYAEITKYVLESPENVVSTDMKKQVIDYFFPIQTIYFQGILRKQKTIPMTAPITFSEINEVMEAACCNSNQLLEASLLLCGVLKDGRTALPTLKKFTLPIDCNKSTEIYQACMGNRWVIFDKADVLNSMSRLEQLRSWLNGRIFHTAKCDYAKKDLSYTMSPHVMWGRNDVGLREPGFGSLGITVEAKTYRLSSYKHGVNVVMDQFTKCVMYSTAFLDKYCGTWLKRLLSGSWCSERCVFEDKEQNIDYRRRRYAHYDFAVDNNGIGHLL